MWPNLFHHDYHAGARWFVFYVFAPEAPDGIAGGSAYVNG